MKGNTVQFYEAGRVLPILLISLAVAIAATFACERRGEIVSRGAAPCEFIDKLPADMRRPVEVNYGNKIKLMGVTVDKLSGNQLKLSYYWRITGALDQYKQVFVHFIDTEHNGILFQNDHVFCGYLPQEIKGRIIKETYIVNIPQSASGREVDVLVGVYAPELPGSPRLEIETAKWAAVGDNGASVEKVDLKVQ